MRDSWEKYFMKTAYLVASRSTCLKRQVGAVIVKDKHIVSTGYNGSPTGIKHCTDRGYCFIEENDIPRDSRHAYCYAVHAEQNAIIQAAKTGLGIEGCTLYTTTYPCAVCMKMIINCGIKKIIYAEGYNDVFSDHLGKEVKDKIVIEKYTGDL